MEAVKAEIKNPNVNKVLVNTSQKSQRNLLEYSDFSLDTHT